MNHKQPLPGTRSCAPEQAVALILLLDLMGYHGRSFGSIDLFGRNRAFRWSFSTRGVSSVRRSCFGNTLRSRVVFWVVLSTVVFRVPIYSDRTSHTPCMCMHGTHVPNPSGHGTRTAAFAQAGWNLVGNCALRPRRTSSRRRRICASSRAGAASCTRSSARCRR